MDKNYSQLADKAYNLHISGNLQEAKELYEKLISINSEDINIQNLYAQLNVSIKNFDIALTIFNKIYEQTKLDDIKLNIAKVYFYKSDFISSIENIKQIQNKDVNALKLLALSYIKSEQYLDAIKVYTEQINTNNYNFSDLFNISIAYMNLSDFPNSLEYALKAYTINALDYDINMHLSFLYEQIDNCEKAIYHLKNIAEKVPSTEIYNRIAILYKKLKNDEFSVNYFLKVIDLKPNDKNALLNIAMIYKNYDKCKSIEILENLKALYPEDISIKNHLYYFYYNASRLEDSYKIAQEILDIKNDNVETYEMAGDSLYEMERYIEAETMYQCALEHNAINEASIVSKLANIFSITDRNLEAIELLKKYPNDIKTQTTYAFIQWKNKNLNETRELLYNWLDKLENEEDTLYTTKKLFYKYDIGKRYNVTEEEFLKNKRENTKKELIKKYAEKKWKNEDIRGKRLLIHSANGAGDLIMFSRYINNLEKITDKLIIQVPKSCFRLFKSSFKNIELYTDDFGEIDTNLYDYTTSFFRLLYNIKVDLNHIEYPHSYLSVDSKLIDEKSKLKEFDTTKKKIGIFWQGNPAIWQNRSVSLNYFLPLFEINEIQIYSFQLSHVDYESEQLKKTLPIFDLAPYIKDFADTAALLKNIDILITIDTSIANLAGALGIKTYLLLPFNSEWRWFNDTSSTPWYDSIKIFKQTIPNNWTEVIQRVKNELTL